MRKGSPLGRTRPGWHWEVFAVLGDGKGHGSCGHRHETEDKATLCPWTPDPWPEVCDLRVAHVRTDREPLRARRSA